MPDTFAATAEQLDSRQLLAALRSFKKGDFSVRLPMGLTGIEGEIADTFNDVVEMNQLMAKEFERLGTVVGKEGKIGQRGKVAGATGGWATSVDSVNTLIGDMVQPTAEVARVIGAVARGDLSQTMLLEIDGRPLRGEFLRIGKIVNTMVDQLSSFASEVTRVAREVGTEGKLGGQAQVKGVAGTWKDLTDNVNAMATNLTGQVRNIAEVTTAVANGDLSKKITVDVKGEILELKNTINTMVDQLNSFASEVTRVAREVGTEGKLGGQARVEGVAGTWKDLTDNVNAMATNLTGQVRNIAEVTTAVANGDLSKKITVDVKGEILELKNTINTMVDQLELLRVGGDARRPRGRHRGQAGRPGAREGRRRHLEGPHRQRERDGDQPDRPGAQHRRGDDRGRDGRPVEEDHGRREGRDPGAEEHHQHDGGPAELLRLGSHARRPRGGHRGQARRPGPGDRRRRHLEGPDRQRERDGHQPDRPGAQHRRGDDRGRDRRPVQEDHGGCRGRNPGAEGHHQHDGGPAQLLRLGGDARRARGGHGRQARRPGPGGGRRRHLEGPDRQRERDGHQPDRPGAQHRRGDHRGRQGRPVEEDHRRREGRDPGAEGHHQHDGGPAHLLRLGGDARRARGRHRRQARRPGAGEGRRRHLEGPHRQRERDGDQPDRPGAQHRRGDHRGRDAATCRRRSPST